MAQSVSVARMAITYSVADVGVCAGERARRRHHMWRHPNVCGALVEPLNSDTRVMPDMHAGGTTSLWVAPGRACGAMALQLGDAV